MRVISSCYFWDAATSNLQANIYIFLPVMLKSSLISLFLTAKSYKDCYMSFVSGKVMVPKEVCVDASTAVCVFGDFFLKGFVR